MKRSAVTESNAGTGLTRRTFVGRAIAAAASAASVSAVALAADAPAAFAAAPAAPASKPARKIKIGIVGCGGRGAWITSFFVKHGGYEFVAVADYFPEVAQATGKALGLDKSKCFPGLSGYKRVLESGVEALIIEDIPYFYPEQAQAAVDAGCHVYIAKPIAVDVPGCLAIEKAAQQAAQKKRCFLVDYQLPTQQPNIEVAKRIREGAIGRVAHILSSGLIGGGTPPAKGPTLASRFRGQTWTGDIALGGDCLLFYDIHIIDGVTWVMGKRPVSAEGQSRICRAVANGDRIDHSTVLFRYEDGTIWTHISNVLPNNCDLPPITADFFGLSASARVQYWGKAYVHGGPKHYVGNIGSIYDDGVVSNVAEFYRNVTEGHFENPTARRGVDGTLTAILGREAAARGRRMTMDEVIKENRRLEVDLTGLQA